MSPIQRSLAKLRKEGWTAAVVEKWNTWVKIRQDLFGFADILAFRGHHVLLVQSTSGTNVSARVAKLQANPIALAWLQSPHRLLRVHGWAKRGDRGKVKHWTCREVWMDHAFTIDLPGNQSQA